MLEFLLFLVRDALLLLGHISGGGSFPKPLGREEEAKCIAAMHAGDEDARAKLIEHNLRLVAHVVRKYTVPGYTQDDLVSVGTLGLIKAVKTYKPDAKTPLSTYAARCIENAILSQMRLWFQTSTPRAEKNPNGVFWHRFPRISTSFVPLRTAM